MNPVSRVCGQDMSELSTIPDAFLYIRDGLIADFGTMRIARKYRDI